jgi:hypothetical protein
VNRGAWATPAAFALSDDENQIMVFKASAKRSAYDSSFAIDMKYSDGSKNKGEHGKSAAHATVVAASSKTSVDSPDYTLAFDSFDLHADAADKVYDISNAGTADLTSVSQDGEKYAILAAGAFSSLTPTFAEVNTAWAGVTTPSTLANGGADPSIAASEFLTDGQTLPQTRWLVVRHLDADTNVLSYETFQITFSAPL